MVTLGGTEIIPAQQPCPGPDTCLIGPRLKCPGYFYRFISVNVMPATTSPILEIAATFNIPPGASGNPTGILVDLVQMEVI
jgi:hypothetical protein